MIFFGFTIGGAILSHSFRFHLECNSYNSWLNYMLEYDESSNGTTIVFELFKIQMLFSIMSNCQDLWFNTSESYYIRQDHLTQEEIKQNSLNDNEDIIEAV